MDIATLAQRIKDEAFLEGDFILRSGKRSKYYLDKYLFSAQPDILAELGKRFAEFAGDADVIAGPELGAVSLAASTSMASGKPFCIVRKAQKGYGTDKLIEGAPVDGKKVLLVEDIGTTAGAALSAVETLVANGAIITRMCFALNREEGAKENVEAAGYEFQALLSKSDLGI
ncbi:MAG: orotate phosphoribosyltransferase [Phycisphaerales bacterium]|jgi:orotate phosphoribosyltransferase|nr:orotate phosphoribosyltransferase [Phycisphaerales bacterium]MBT7170379.1 orotate phosphoribosyltransferase [Phycisphaerales bacterium]